MASRSQRHALEVHGLAANGDRGHEETASVTTGAPTSTGLNLTPTGAGAVNRIMFLNVPVGDDDNQLEYTLGGGGDNAFPDRVWVATAAFDNIKVTKGATAPQGVYSYRYIWEDVNYDKYYGVLDVTVGA